MFKNFTIDFNALYNSLGNSMCSSPEVVLAFLLYDGSTIHNASSYNCRLQLHSHVIRSPECQSSVSDAHASDRYALTSNSCIFTPIENWTHVYMNLFTRNSPYYHLLKYLLFLLKHIIYIYIYIYILYIYIYIHILYIYYIYIYM